MERFQICSQKTGVKTRALTFDGSGRLYIADKPVLLGAAATFYAEARQRGKIALGMPSAHAIAEVERRVAEIEVETGKELEGLCARLVEEEAKEEEALKQREALREKIEKLQEEIKTIRATRLPVGGDAPGVRRRITALEDERDERIARAGEPLQALKDRATIPEADLRAMLARLDEREVSNA